MNKKELTDATIKVLTESLLRKKQEARETNRVQDMVELGYTFDEDLENKMLDYCTGVVGRKQDVIEELKNEPVLITPKLEKAINETRGDIIYVLFIALTAQVKIDKIDTIILGLSGNKVIDKKVGNFQKDIEPKQETKLVEDESEFTTNLKNAKDNPIWVIGDVTYNGKKYKVNAKVFLTSSDYGIDEGPVSILWVGKPTVNGYGKPSSETIINYSRKWDVEPRPEYKDLYEKILKAVMEFRNDHPYEVEKQPENVDDEENL